MKKLVAVINLLADKYKDVESEVDKDLIRIKIKVPIIRKKIILKIIGKPVSKKSKNTPSSIIKSPNSIPSSCTSRIR